MQVEQVLIELLSATEQPMARAHAALRDAQEEVARIEAERYGLELALARLRREPAPRPPVDETPSTNEWQVLDRTKAVERVLIEAGAPVHRQDIVRRLAVEGRRGDTVELVSAALAHLNKQRRAVGLGSGMWAARTVGATNADGPAEAGPSEGTRTAPAAVTAGPDLGGEVTGSDGDPRAPDHHPAPLTGAN